MKRNGFLAVVIVVTPLFLSSIVSQIIETPIPGDPVSIDSGKIAGKLLPSGVKAYFGIPYVAAPTGDNRWREPQPMKPWNGILYAARMGPSCIQPLRAHDINHYFGEEPTSEDCLYMNIWAPGDAKSGEKRPVLVWIYGGGLNIGSSGMALYFGENLAQKGVVYASFNYRVNAFGYMAHPSLSAESPHRTSGNYGFLDQLEALKWINRNIAKFGGDPGDVTIMGQSAGAGSVFAQVTSPLSRGLFQHAVAMSGGWIRPGNGAMTPTSLKEAEQSGLEMQEALKVNSLAELRNVPADRILAAGVRVGHNVDGYFYPQTPEEIFAAGKQNPVTIMAGFCYDEAWNALRTARNAVEYKQAAQQMFGSRTAEFLALFPGDTDPQARQSGADAVRLGGMAWNIRTWALAQAKTGKNPFYMYIYNHAHPYVPGVRIADQDTVNPAAAPGSYHTSEVPYFLRNQDALNLIRKTRDWTEFDRQLSERMSDILIAFAKTGDPNTGGVKWPRFDADSQQVLEFGETIHVTNLDKKRMDFFSTLAAPIPMVLSPPAPVRAHD